ncbi:MAG: PDZ domain-containing protein, partial [Terriglobales bacterium]
VVTAKERPFVMPHLSIPHIEAPMIATFSRRHGVTVENLTAQLGEVFGVKNGEGVLVRSVDKGSPGDTAGLRAGDVIVRVGSERVERTSDWSRALREQKPGPVQIGIVRDKRQQAVSLAVPEPTTERSSVRAFRGEDFSPDMEGFDADMEEFSHSMDELNRVRPEIDRAMRETQEKVRRELERSRREAERARRQAQRDFEQAQRDSEQKQHDFEQKQRDFAQKQRDRAMREQDRAQHEAEKQQQKQLEKERQKEQEKSPPAEKPPQ